jgi:aquaporin Z
MDQRQLSTDFLDRALEWRRIFAEPWGTFLWVVVAAGGGVVAVRSGGAVTAGIVVVAPGLTIMAIIYFMGAVSGAHLNPAVTLAFAIRRNFPWNRVPGYVWDKQSVVSWRRFSSGPSSVRSARLARRYQAVA